MHDIDESDKPTPNIADLDISKLNSKLDQLIDLFEKAITRKTAMNEDTRNNKSDSE